MAVDRRMKDQNWIVSDDGKSGISVEHVHLAVLMDIRDELQAIRSLANCYRIPCALDAMIELGAEARRKKRAATKKRKAAKR